MSKMKILQLNVHLEAPLIGTSWRGARPSARQLWFSSSGPERGAGRGPGESAACVNCICMFMYVYTFAFYIYIYSMYNIHICIYSMFYISVCIIYVYVTYSMYNIYMHA